MTESVPKEETQKKEKVKMIKKERTPKKRFKKMLSEAFGLERMYHIVIVVVSAVICGLLVASYILT